MRETGAKTTNTNMDKTVNDDLSGRKDIFRVFTYRRVLCAPFITMSCGKWKDEWWSNVLHKLYLLMYYFCKFKF